MDLFSEGNTVYVIDTSALMRLDLTFKRENPVFTAIWEEIEDLIVQGRFLVIDFVEQEINEYRGKEIFLKDWVNKWRKRLVVETDANSFNAARPIINEEYNTGFLKPNKQAEGKEEADPYLIGFCKVHNYVLITDENKLKPNRIPAVAHKNGVKCIDVYEFLHERGLRMERRKP
ncbi:DUF4411 family protein [Mariniradius saccharolyticus]|uniref:DUF4411 family protein n=1 Tax=Mariniradius saccharolyticus TaxID=1245591 RepID=UPI0009DA20E0|nr:DUF4411 family protein [Mariniradius saccharolyticus]